MKRAAESSLRRPSCNVIVAFVVSDAILEANTNTTESYSPLLISGDDGSFNSLYQTKVSCAAEPFDPPTADVPAYCTYLLTYCSPVPYAAVTPLLAMLLTCSVLVYHLRRDG